MGCPSVTDAMASCALREAMLKGRQQSRDCKAGDGDRRGFEVWTGRRETEPDGGRERRTEEELDPAHTMLVVSRLACANL